MKHTEPRRVLAEGRFARLVAQDGWEWVERVNTSGAVVIVAVTENAELLLVEQYRIPLASRVIELPAGLVGDVAGSEHEKLAEAACRELREETGYEATHWEYLTEGPASAGLSNETYALFLVRKARQVGPGGGDEREDIQVHRVPLHQVPAWLRQRRQQGILVDPRVYAGLYFANADGPECPSR
jgi:ADP-ribose pyrophosphatase